MNNSNNSSYKKSLVSPYASMAARMTYVHVPSFPDLMINKNGHVLPIGKGIVRMYRYNDAKYASPNEANTCWCVRLYMNDGRIVTKSVKRMVAEAFIDPAVAHNRNMYVYLADGNPNNICPENMIVTTANMRGRVHKRCLVNGSEFASLTQAAIFIHQNTGMQVKTIKNMLYRQLPRIYGFGIYYL